MPPARSKKEHHGGNDYLTLNEISERTGIPYPRVLRHYRLHKSDIPNRLVRGTPVFPGEAVKIFSGLEKGSKKRDPHKIHVTSRESGSDIRDKLGIKKAETRRARRALREVGVEVGSAESLP